VSDALGEAVKCTEKFDQGMGFARWVVTTYRTEERRKV